MYRNEDMKSLWGYDLITLIPPKNKNQKNSRL